MSGHNHILLLASHCKIQISSDQQADSLCIDLSTLVATQRFIPKKSKDPVWFLVIVIYVENKCVFKVNPQKYVPKLSDPVQEGPKSAKKASTTTVSYIMSTSHLS